MIIGNRRNKPLYSPDVQVIFYVILHSGMLATTVDGVEAGSLAAEFPGPSEVTLLSIIALGNIRII